MSQQKTNNMFKEIDDMNISLLEADKAYDKAIADGKLEEELVRLWTSSDQIKRKLQDLQTKLLDFMQANEQANVQAMEVEDKTEEKVVEDPKFPPAPKKYIVNWCLEDEGDEEENQVDRSEVPENECLTILGNDYFLVPRPGGFTLKTQSYSFRLDGAGPHIVNLADHDMEEPESKLYINISEVEPSIVVPVPVGDDQKPSDHILKVVMCSPERGVDRDDNVQQGVATRFFDEAALTFYFVSVNESGVGFQRDMSELDKPDTQLSFPGHAGFHRFSVQREDGTMGLYGLFLMPADQQTIERIWDNSDEESDEDLDMTASKKRKRTGSASEPNKRLRH